MKPSDSPKAFEELRLTGAPLRSDPDVTAAFARDSTDLLNAGQPLAVVTPRDASEVAEILKWANRHGVGVVTRGAHDRHLRRRPSS